MTIWYAQNSTVDINSAGEWNDIAGGGGNVLTWANLASGDVLCANGKTAIAINVDVNVGATGRISTVAEGTGTAGGGFTGGATVSITGNILAGTTTCITTAAGTYTVTITGNITGGSGTSIYGINKSVSTATFNITGDCAGGTGNSAHGFFSNQAGSNSATGTISGGSGSSASGVANTGTGTLTIVGNLINLTTAPAINGKIIYNPGPTNYIQYPAPGATTVNSYSDIPDVGNVVPPDTVAGVTGTYSVGGGLPILGSSVVG